MKTLVLAFTAGMVLGSVGAMADPAACGPGLVKSGQVCTWKHFPSPAQDFIYPSNGGDQFVPTNFGGSFQKDWADTVVHCNGDMVITADPGTPVGIGIFINGGRAGSIEATDSVAYGTLTQVLDHTFDGLAAGTYDFTVYLVSPSPSAKLHSTVSQLECSEQAFPASQP